MNMQFCTPPGFASPYGFPQGQGAPMTYADPQYSMHPAYPGLQYMYGYQTHRPPMMTDRGGLCDGKTESKPRLSKEEVEKLEKVFQENPKPSSSVKAQLADSLGLERPRINNWFQNRRAKAKQERKQEEYEARRAAADKSASEPSSPDEDSCSRSLDCLNEGSHKRTQPSSAAFPDVSSPSQTPDTFGEEEEDEEEEEEEEEEDNEDENDEVTSHSHQNTTSVCMQPSIPAQAADLSDSYHSPLSMEFPQSDSTTFTHPHTSAGYTQSRSGSDFGLFPSLGHDHNSLAMDVLPRSIQRSMSTDAHIPQHYASMHSTALQSSSGMFFSPLSNSDACDMSDSPFDTTSSPDCHNDQSSQAGSRGMATPTDSFRSPPPPANIASRRNIPRPAALQAASLRSRPYNVPKTAMDGSKRMDMPSPVASIRRISSVTGLSAGRIQKPSAGPRSPFFGRAEALMQQYHTRSPVGSGTPTFSGVAPQTPMTPALFDQHHGREPAVMSASPDDSSFVLGGMGVASNYVQEVKGEHELKTPPTTPGMMAEFGANGGYVVGSHNNAFGSGFNITHHDQPLLTPYFHSEFPDLSVQNVPGYVEASDDGPTTPVYASMMGSGVEHASFTGNVMANTQYDWDANESVVSSRSSPSYPRAKQIQFTPNMTPQDYH